MGKYNRNKFNNDSILRASKSLGIAQNLYIRVIDQTTGEVVQEHKCHNTATNSLLLGIAHHLIGDFFPDQRHGASPGYPLLSNYVPRYISLGTMGLINQLQDEHGLPAGIGVSVPNIDSEELEQARQELEDAKAALDADCPYYAEHGECYTGESCEQCSERLTAKKTRLAEAQANYDRIYNELMLADEETRFAEYMNTRPGYGADGYDANENNGRKYLGLGYPYQNYDPNIVYHLGDKVMYNGILYQLVVESNSASATVVDGNIHVGTSGRFNPEYWVQLPDSDQPSLNSIINLELVSPTFPRELISYRDIVPEYESELPKTIDVVFSAMISTGALKQFRPKVLDKDGRYVDQGYIFITEAGLWSKRTWEDSGENGLLAAYRIAPPNPENWVVTTEEAQIYIDTHGGEDFPYPPGVSNAEEYATYNRQLLKKSILRVGVNQVVQVVWKIQLGSAEELGTSGISEYIVWKSYVDQILNNQNNSEEVNNG